MRIPRNVLILGFVSLLNDASSEMILPIVPLFLTDILKASKLASGSIMGLIESCSSLFKVAFGYASDKMKRRKFFVTIGYLLSMVSKAALAFSISAIDFLILRLIDRTGKSIRTAPRDAIIAESGGKMGRSFGFHRMLDTLGAVIGPLMAISILSLIGITEKSIRSIFLFSAIPAFFGVTFLYFVKDTGKTVNRVVVSSIKSREMQLILLSIFIASLGRYSYAFTLWRAEELGYNIIQGIIFYTIFNIVYSLTAYPIGAISDVVGKKSIIMAGFILFGFSSLLFAFTQSWEIFMLAFILYGVSVAIEDTIPRAYISDLASDSDKGTVLGIYHTVYGSAVFPASVIVAFFWQEFNLSWGFLYAVFMNFAAAAFIMSTYLLESKKLEN